MPPDHTFFLPRPPLLCPPLVEVSMPHYLSDLLLNIRTPGSTSAPATPSPPLFPFPLPPSLTSSGQAHSGVEVRSVHPSRHWSRPCRHLDRGRGSDWTGVGVRGGGEWFERGIHTKMLNCRGCNLGEGRPSPSQFPVHKGAVELAVTIGDVFTPPSFTTLSVHGSLHLTPFSNVMS